jgi:hypothetical protein
MGMQSRMKYVDYFQLAPYLHYHETTPGDKRDREERKGDEKNEATLYSWSIYGALHALDMQTF